MQLVQFGHYEVDLDAALLQRDGRRIRLQRRPFQVLTLLLANPGELVTRETLRTHLWPEGVFVDFDHGLNTAVRKLREALGDEAGHPRFIETVERRGYRFIARVTIRNQVSHDRPVLQREPPSNLPTESVRTAEEGSTTVVRKPNAIGWKRPTVAALCLLLVGSVAIQLRHSRSVARLEPPRIAVLPFQIFDATQTDEYLGLRLTDSVIARLSRLSRIIVRPTSTIRKYTGTAFDPLAAGRDLGVDTILEGSVQRVADRVRVTARLLRVADGEALWADRLDKPFTDLLAVEDAIAQWTAVGVLSSISRDDRRQLAFHETQSPRASECYAKARFFWNKRSAEGYLKAIELFEAAIAADAGYARAYSGLADAYLLVSGYGHVAPESAIPKAKAAAYKAVALDPMLAEAHASLALLAENYDWDWEAAERHYKDSLAADPNYPTAHHWYGEFLSLMGRADEAFAELSLARALDPVSLSIRRDTAQAFLYAREYERAAQEARETLELDSTFELARDTLATAYMMEGKTQESEAELRKMHLPQDSPQMISSFAQLAAFEGRKADALRGIKRLSHLGHERYVSPMLSGWVYLYLGEKSLALDCLERAIQQHEPIATSLLVIPAYDCVRAEPRFHALLRQVRLEQ